MVARALSLLALVALVVAAPARADDVVEAGADEPLAKGPFSFTVEAPLSLSAVTASSGVETSVSVWPGVRGGLVYDLDGSLFVGADAALLGTVEGAGTSGVSVTRAFGALEGRAFAGASFGGRFARILPYAYTGPFVALGVGWLSVHGEGTARFLASPGWRAGAGTMLRLGALQARLDLGLGVRELRLEVTTSFSLGGAF